jgi:hypothetical protein
MYRSPGSESENSLPEEPTKDPWERNQPAPWQWALIAGIAVVVLGCLVAFFTLTFHTYSTWTENRTQSATQVAASATAEVRERLAVIQEAKKWPLLMQDSFNDNANEWLEGEIDDEYVSMTLTVDNHYLWNATAKQGVVWRVWPRSDILSDLYLAVDVQNQGRNQSAQYGAIFYNDEGTYCYLEVSDAGYYRVASYDGQSWLDLIPATYSVVIQPGEINQLVIAAKAGTFYIQINNQFVGSGMGCTKSSGQAGIAIGLTNPGDHGNIIFDNFELRTPGTGK